VEKKKKTIVRREGSNVSKDRKEVRKEGRKEGRTEGRNYRKA
jgi:hypothetical protein